MFEPVTIDLLMCLAFACAFILAAHDCRNCLKGKDFSRSSQAVAASRRRVFGVAWELRCICVNNVFALPISDFSGSGMVWWMKMMLLTSLVQLFWVQLHLFACGWPWHQFWTTLTIRSTSKFFFSGTITTTPPMFTCFFTHFGRESSQKQEMPIWCSGFLDGRLQLKVPVVSMPEVRYPVLWHIQRHWVLGNCQRTQGHQGTAGWCLEVWNFGAWKMDTGLFCPLATAAECVSPISMRETNQKMARTHCWVVWHCMKQRLVYLKPVAAVRNWFIQMAFAKLQPWHPYFGFPCFIPSALRCLSSQPLQSQSKCWQVSSLGRLCSTHGIISRGTLATSGYRVVYIARQIWKVHRVVKLTHHGFPPNTEAWQVNHLDGDKTNNALVNLEYVTPAKNLLHSYSTLLRRDTWHIQSRPISWRVLGGNEWTSCCSMVSVARQLGMQPSTISKSCRHNVSVKGYEFRYQDIEQPQVDGEEWRPIVSPISGLEVPGRFVSSLGRIKSLHGHIHWGCRTKCGYYHTQVQGRTFAVHRLVAFAFLGAPTSRVKSQVNHKDLDKGNNAVKNLEYVTPAANAAHFHSNTDFTRAAGLKPVCSRAYGSSDEWTWHDSISSAARTLALDMGSISKCVSGRMKKTGGFEFRRANPLESESLPGEVWREVDLPNLLQDREQRKVNSMLLRI